MSTDTDEVATADGIPNSIKILGAIFAIVTSVASTYAAIQSHANSDTLQVLVQKEQSSLDFAKEMASSQQYFVSPKYSTEAMISSLRLYNLADTIPKKLAVVEIVKYTGQNRALLALAPLIREDPQVWHPNGDDASGAAAIQETAKEARDSENTAEAKKPANREDAVNDPPLTSSSNVGVRANAQLLAALPQSGSVGYIFTGDVLQSSPTTFVSGTASTDATTVPHLGQTLIACSYINVRDAPFNGGQLGQLVTVVEPGTSLTVLTPVPMRFGAIGKFSKKPIYAMWSKVQILPNPRPPDASKCAPGPTRANS